MRLLNRLTLKSLRLNMKRTVVTVIGIILATAMLSAVSSLAASFRGSMVEYEKKTSGDFHYAFYNVPTETVAAIEKNRNVDSYFEMVGLGYALLPGCKNPDKPYLYVAAMDEDAFAKATVELTEGRLPENDGEIIISKHIKTNGGVEFHVGDVLTLDVGGRYLLEGVDGEDSVKADAGVTPADRVDSQSGAGCVEKPLNQWEPNENGYDTEELRPVFTATYRIVGITERLYRGAFEDRMAPGYTVLTYMEKGQWQNLPHIYDGVDIFVRYSTEKLPKMRRNTGEILGIDADLYEKFCGDELTEEVYDLFLEQKQHSLIKNYKENEHLLRYETMDLRNSNLQFLYSVVAILIGIIIFSAAFCIRNSFAISITEKMKQYGMLSSVGATPRQIRKNVYYEAGILAVLGIPLGILSGIFACWILVKVVGGLLGEALSMELQFSFHWTVVLLSAFFAGVMIFLSAAKPARKAGKVSPIAAINGLEDIRLSQKSLRIPGIVKTVFGIGGVLAYKSMKRNKKSYRVVVVSMVVSVSIFVALSYFVGMAFDSSSFYVKESAYNLQINAYDVPDEYLRRMEELDGVKRVSVLRPLFVDVPRDSIPYTEEGKKYSYGDSSVMHVYSVGKREYARFLEDLGISPEAAEGKAVYINESFEIDGNTGKRIYYTITTWKKGDAVEFFLQEDSEGETPFFLTLAAVTKQRPLGLEGRINPSGYLIVSDRWMDAYWKEYGNAVTIYMDCEDADKVQAEIINSGLVSEANVYNLAKQQREERSLYLVIAIFLYGFIGVISLIGITNIFNTVTKNMELRSREFAMLRSIGMTGREFDRMVGMESIFYGGKSLFFGLLIGGGLSYIIYLAMVGGVDMGYRFPWKGAGIAIAAVALLLFGIMRYSLVRIRRQNIIETIRQENI